MAGPVADKITVVVPAHNAATTVARAIRSALAEPEVAEIMLIDDASTDDTTVRARDADDKSGRLKILGQARNAGPSAARNRAIRESTSPWIAILDADDFFLPGRMSRLLEFGESSDFVADDAVQAMENAPDGPRRSLLGVSGASPRMINFSEFVEANVTDPKRQRGELGFIKPIMRRGFLEKHNLEYREDMRLGEDYELYARALAHGARLCLVPEPGYVSVVRPDSLSGRHSTKDLQSLRDCDDLLLKDFVLSAPERRSLRRHYSSVDCRLQWRRLIDAKKNRDWRAALAAFRRPHPVPSYLLGQLAKEFMSRFSPGLKRHNA
ncbi:MAG: glycosyltransferase family 2 protein [Bdellovibrionales bacterium]